MMYTPGISAAARKDLITEEKKGYNADGYHLPDSIFNDSLSC